MQARVYDGSDTGAKIFDTMAVIGKEANDAKRGHRDRAELKRRAPLAGRRLLLRRSLEGRLAGIYAFVRSLREWRLGQPQARLWAVRAARAAPQARTSAGVPPAPNKRRAAAKARSAFCAVPAGRRGRAARRPRRTCRAALRSRPPATFPCPPPLSIRSFSTAPSERLQFGRGDPKQAIRGAVRLSVQHAARDGEEARSKLGRRLRRRGCACAG